LHEEPEPTPDSDEVLLRVTAVGLCGSDRHWFAEGGIGDAVLAQPLVLGHEFVGTVAGGRRAGERVAGDPAISCERCELCLDGNQHLCRASRFAGHSTDGALRTQMAWPERLAMIEARTVIATDSLRHRVVAASAMGATHAMQAGSLDRPAIDGLTEDRGVDVAFEAAGDDAAVTDAIDAVRPGGRVVLVGIPADDHTSFVASTARRKGLTLSLSRRMKPTDLPRAIHLAASGRLQLGRLVTERHDLSDGVQAFASLCERRGLKVVVEP
jgi:L-iditol 2-dehydrogenase